MTEIILVSVRGLSSLDLNSGRPATVIIFENVQGRRYRNIWEVDIKIGI
jgi:hypothetical protein